MTRWPALALAVLLGTAGPAFAAGPTAAAAAVSWSLAEGTTVVLVEDHRVPVVTLELEFPAGNWSPWAWRNQLQEAFEIQLYDSDTALRKRVDELAVELELSVEARASVLRASFLRDELQAVLVLVRDILANRDVDRRELRRWSQQRELDWRAAQREPEFLQDQQAVRLLFSADDPRRRDFERPPPLERDPQRLAAVRDVLIRLPGRVVAFAGDLTRDEASAAAAGLLPPVGAPPEGLAPVLDPPRVAAERPPLREVRLSRLTQVYFDWVRDSPRYLDADYPAFVVADHVLGGHFYSRLSVALRHAGGETYGASTHGGEDVVEEAYGLETSTRAENGETTEQKLRAVLAEFYAHGITEAERQAAVGYLLGNRAFSRQSPVQILERRLTERRLGLEAGFLDELADRAARLDLDEVNAFIARFYDPSRFSLVRVAPR